MFCKKCGTNIDDESTFCPNCGNPAKNTISEIETYTKKKSPYKTIGIIACCLIVILLLSLFFVFFNTSTNSNAEKVSKEYAKSIFTYDYESALKHCVGDFTLDKYTEYFALSIDESQNTDETSKSIKESLSEKYNTSDTKEAIKCYYYDEFKTQTDKLIETYGANYKVDVTTTKISDLDNYESSSIIEEYNSEFGSYYSDTSDTESDKMYKELISNMMIEPATVKKMCKVEVIFDVDGSLSSDTITDYYYCININGQWKILKTNNGFANFNIFGEFATIHLNLYMQNLNMEDIDLESLY